jgi:unsaturated chondroitin disaccharide hydrolase
MTKKVITEALRPVELYQVDRLALRQKLDDALARVTRKLDRNIVAFGDKFPGEACENGIWPRSENVEWTTSFWPGQLWLAWEMSGNPAYREAAERYLPSFARRIEERIDTATHDLGFLYTLSCVSAWRLTGNEAARQSALLAAETLMERYNPTARIIQAWGSERPGTAGADDHRLQYEFTAALLGQRADRDPRYAQAATAHAQQAARYIVREDASTYHTYYIDVNTGEPRFGNTHQGYSDTSCWSRGQAWGIYGFLLSYRYTGDKNMVELSRSLAHYFLNRLPEDDVPLGSGLARYRRGTRQLGGGNYRLWPAGAGQRAAGARWASRALRGDGVAYRPVADR